MNEDERGQIIASCDSIVYMPSGDDGIANVERNILAPEYAESAAIRPAHLAEHEAAQEEEQEQYYTYINEHFFHFAGSSAYLLID